MSPSRRAAAAAAFALGLAAGAELLARRRLGPPPDEGAWSDSARYLHEEARAPFFKAEVRGGARVWRANRPRSSAREFFEAKPAGTKRVFIVGESVAGRFRAGALESAFRAAWGGADVEVVNCGMGAYDSARVAGVFRDVLPHAPDLIVVLAGNNDGPDGPPVRYGAYRLNLALRRGWLWRLAQDRLRPPSPPVVDREAILARMEKNFAGMAREAARRGVPLVFSTLPANERHWPPTGELPLGVPEFFEGWMALQEGRASEAASSLRAFTREKPHDPMGRFWLATALRKAGRTAEARLEFAAALERDWPDRATGRRNELIRRVAREEGAGLADLEADLRGRAPDGLPGWESFTDGVHWRTELDDRFARVIARAAPGARPVPAAPGAAPREEGALPRALSGAVQAGLEYSPPILSERAVALFEQAWREDPARMKDLLEDSGEASRLFAENVWTRFLSERAARHWTGVRCHAGEALWRVGARREALAQFERAVAEDGGSALARLLLAKSLLALGEPRAAEEQLAAIGPDRRESPIADLLRAHYSVEKGPRPGPL